MRLHELHIQNFRSLKDQTIVFDDYTCLVGANGAGKSSILTALNVLFRDSSNSSSSVEQLSREDFHLHDTSKPIEITATFDNLSDAAKTDLRAYVRQGQLVISAKAEWDDAIGAAVVQQKGQRKVMPQFKEYFKADKDKASAAALKETYQGLKKEYGDLPQVTSKGDMLNALREYEESHPDECELEPSDDQFYGWSKGSNLLQKHIQWLFVPAVKDAADEADETKQSVLGQLLARTVRSKVSFKDTLDAILNEATEKYRKALEGQQDLLKDLSENLSDKIKRWAHPDAGLSVVWRDNDAKAVQVNEPSATIQFSEGPFKGEIARFGHGLQRSYLLAILQILAEGEHDTQPTLLLGVEEPELFQHPPQARHLASVLRDLSKGNAQVVTCTHSPDFVPGDQLLSVRVLRRHPTEQHAQVTQCKLDSVAQRIGSARGKDPVNEMVTATKMHQCLNPVIREMFFTPGVVLVEGIEDQAYLMAWMELTGKDKDFHRMGGHIIPANGKSYMIEPLAILEEYGIPSFVIFDSDANETNEERRRKHQNDNLALLRLCGCENPEPFPDACFGTRRVRMWHDNITARVKASAGDESWSQAAQAAKAKHDLHIKNMDKNPMFIGFRLEALRDMGGECQVLDELCDQVINYLSTASGNP